MGKISIVNTGITHLKTDAIVNAANEHLLEGAGVCGAIFKAAGSKELQAACNAIGGCKTGSAVITPGFRLKAKYIIHAVGPRWTGGNHNEPALLYSAYRQSLILAFQNKCKSIGFPLISAGIFGYPVDKAWREAIQACVDFQQENSDYNMDIQFAVIDNKIKDIGIKILGELNKEKTSVYIKLLSARGLQRIREHIAQDSDLLMDKKAHPLAGGLLNIICDPKVIILFSVNQLIQVIDSIFPPAVLEEAWISKYGNILLRIVSEARSRKKNARAETYEKYLSEVMIPALIAGSHSGTVWDDIERLEDIYKIAVCLYRFYKEKDADFIFDVDRESMDKLNQAVQNVIISGGNILGIKIVLGGIEERQYATFLSWVLEEMLIEHEGLEEGEE